jgi:hypothetical protein
MRLPRTFGSRAAPIAIAAAVALAAGAAYSSAVQSPQLGSMSSVNFCVRKAGPEKGAVRFVERRSYCRAYELRVKVLGEGSTQAALGLAGAGASVARQSSQPAEISYARVEAVSPPAAGAPETASATVACPGGAALTGGGFRVDAGRPSAANNPAEIVVTEDRPVAEASWSVTAFAADAEAVGPWSLAAYAICASPAG